MPNDVIFRRWLKVQKKAVKSNDELVFHHFVDVNKMGLAEQRGRFKNMGQLSPKPSFDLKADMVEVMFGRTSDFIAESKGVDSNLLSQENKDGLLFIEENKEISVSDYASHFSLQSKTANRRLKNLIDKGLVVQIGEKKGTRYKLK